MRYFLISFLVLSNVLILPYQTTAVPVPSENYDVVGSKIDALNAETAQLVAKGKDIEKEMKILDLSLEDSKKALSSAKTKASLNQNNVRKDNEKIYSHSQILKGLQKLLEEMLDQFEQQHKSSDLNYKTTSEKIKQNELALTAKRDHVLMELEQTQSELKELLIAPLETSVQKIDDLLKATKNYTIEHDCDQGVQMFANAVDQRMIEQMRKLQKSYKTMITQVNDGHKEYLQNSRKGVIVPLEDQIMFSNKTLAELKETYEGDEAQFQESKRRVQEDMKLVKDGLAKIAEVYEDVRMTLGDSKVDELSSGVEEGPVDSELAEMSSLATAPGKVTKFLKQAEVVIQQVTVQLTGNIERLKTDASAWKLSDEMVSKLESATKTKQEKLVRIQQERKENKMSKQKLALEIVKTTAILGEYSGILARFVWFSAIYILRILCR